MVNQPYVKSPFPDCNRASPESNAELDAGCDENQGYHYRPGREDLDDGEAHHEDGQETRSQRN